MLTKMRYHDDGLVEFNKLREQRLQTPPLDLLATALMTLSSEPEQRLTNEPPATSEIFEEVQRRELEELQRKEQEEAQRKEQERICEEEQKRYHLYGEFEESCNPQILHIIALA